MNMTRYYRQLTLCFSILSALFLTGCATPNPIVNKDFESDYQTQTYQAEAYLITSAPEAFARRIALVRQAKQSIDMTYFSWNGDTLGLTLLNELKQAADRGVQVRLTLDDLLVFNDKWLADIDNLSNIQIRIFNPFNSRKSGWAGRAADFSLHQQTLDHRLHEKYFNVDHQRMILGGRNIGDEYFGYSKTANFYDLDVMFSGEVIKPFADNYERLWASEHLVPVSSLIHIKQSDGISHFTKAFKKAKKQHPETVANVEQTLSSLPTEKFTTVMVSPVFDSLNKLDDRLPYFRSRSEAVLKQEIAAAKNVTISTPYIIPTHGKFNVINQLTQQGTNVRLVTNSSASNDSTFLPAYYEEHRKTLLDMGVDIYEYKDSARNEDHYYHGDTYYHNKTMILDDKISYVGSSNFDPRSDFLNVEFGLFVHSEAFAQQINEYLFKEKNSLYWHVTQSENGEIQWQSGQEVQLSSPNYGSWHHLPDWIFKKMNGESEL
ncbi:phospholipase D family protein [Shewanella olleyana]|uniref:phospholipase D-like domain-containing protein n=1 Tax=Shewanella olleyana TaxID=135626 RepID=UPI00200F0585|nr:phospholipase D family protein [Shewanella olleyana]MCL1065783.1 phospholipase D family protein [Shewanella olleyana]